MDMSRLLSDGAPELEQHPVWRYAGTMVSDAADAAQPNSRGARAVTGTR